MTEWQKRTRGLEYHVVCWVDGEGTNQEQDCRQHTWRKSKKVWFRAPQLAQVAPQGRKASISGTLRILQDTDWLGGEGDGDSETLR